MRKRIISALLALAMAASLTAGFSQQKTLAASYTVFPDVSDPSVSYYQPVYWAVSRGIVKGYSNGYFGPNDSCTRAQFVTMLWRFSYKPEPYGRLKVNFSDVNSSVSYYKAIQWAVSRGIIVGFKDGTFRPNEPVTRRQVAVMLWRYQGKPVSNFPNAFRDVGESDSGVKAICWGAIAGLLKGYSDGTFRPDDKCLRKHIVIIIYRYARDFSGQNMTI